MVGLLLRGMAVCLKGGVGCELEPGGGGVKITATALPGSGTRQNISVGGNYHEISSSSMLSLLSLLYLPIYVTSSQKLSSDRSFG